MSRDYKATLKQLLEICDIIGVRNTFLLYTEFANKCKTFPSIETLVRGLSNRDLVHELKKEGIGKRKYSLKTVIKQAKKYNMTMDNVYDKLEKLRKKMAENPDIEII